ncbi:outer membrane beta-barrel protein [Polaribacter sp. Hel_I_88]|uniref:outer membrane beta-barrel protein n=1 Tax=Polaribacter sp. Hel_I_88 TaxID=1250006 RepID=UPI00047B1291|nr:outer membrane beta-barrel protein [Polaribacter sp. Hel_I_88]
MKKVILVFALVLSSLAANAQLSVSVNAGLPVSDVEEFSSFALSGDVGYSFATESNLMLGVSVGFLNYFGKDYEVLGTTFEAESTQFLPVAGSLMFRLTDSLSAGSKLGYAFGINDGNDGGFYYKPMLSYAVGNETSLSLFYEGVSNDGINANNVGLGFTFGL